MSTVQQPDNKDRPARLTVGVVGAGRVGPTLAASLQLAGHRPVAVSGVSDASRRRAALMLPDVPLVTPEDVLQRADLVLLTVPDDTLPGLVEGLAETGAVRPGQLLVHTSGRYGAKVLDPALRAGALPLALHPAMTFTGTPVDVQRLAGCSFGVTAPEELRLAAEALVIEMGGEPEWIEEEKRPLYHAALALGANHLVTLVAQAMELLRSAGVGAPDRMLGPLLGAALDNALRSGDAALTGPVARGDAGTVAAHVTELRRRPADRRGLSRDGPRDRGPGARPRTAEAGARRGPPRGTRHGHQRLRGRRPMTTTLLRTAGELHARARVGRRAVVMTMGALHEGHATLIRTAREIAGPDGEVVATVFVNPLQFGAGEDLDRYPRTLDADLKIAEDAGADAVFAPSVDEVYPGGEPQVRISAGPMGERLEGASRPGHFDGMLTVVAKLLHLTRPDIALYGQKDAQQLALIRRMVRDLNFGVEIVGVPTVREDDGLALSSRNRYLKPQERRTALALSRALFAGRDRHAAQEALRARAREVPATHARAEALSALGESRAAADAHAVAKALPGAPSAVRAASRLILDDAARQDPPLALDYLALVDPTDFSEIDDDFTGEAVLAVAARVGTTRLIDNIPLTFGAAS